MGRFVQKSNGKGSLKCLQTVINNKPSIINNEIKTKIGKKNISIDWLSPLKEDDYAEYRDIDFIKMLNVDTNYMSLKEFWPNNGPQWDGLAKGYFDNKEIAFLIEAKANIPEMVSPPSGAKSEKSIALINKSLNDVKGYVKSSSQADWSSYFYQYCNRLAHLYYLRVINKIPTYMVFVYFIGDETVDGPTTKEEWIGAIKVMKNYLGIDKRHKLSEYVIDIFIDKSDLEI